MKTMNRPRNYNVSEAAELLGIKPRTIRDWVLLRKIEYIRIGRAIRISEAEIDRILNEGRVPVKK